MDRESLAQKLRVPCDFDVDTRTRCTADSLDKLGSGPDRNRGLPDDHRRPCQPRCESVDYAVHMAEVGAVFAPLLRSANPEEMHIGEVGSQVVVGGESKTTRGDVVPQHLSQTGLVEWNIARSQLGDLTRIDVHTDDFVPQFGHSRSVGSTQITRTKNGAPHTPVCRLPQ